MAHRPAGALLLALVRNVSELSQCDLVDEIISLD